jgi:hypothetical protein
MTQQQRKRAILKIRRNRLVRGKIVLPIGVREILQTIVDEMGTCGGKCDDQAIRFGADSLKVAKAALQASKGGGSS